MKCDELKAHKGDVYIPVYGSIADADVYLKKDADAAIAELKEKLMPCLNGDCILTCEVVEKYGKENAELKEKLEDVGMRERRLRRALWLAREKRAAESIASWNILLDNPDVKIEDLFDIDMNDLTYGANDWRTIRNCSDWAKAWAKVWQKCRAKAEEYK